MDHEGNGGAARHWDEMYRSRPRVWSGRPNPQLVAEAAGLEPGTALDLGCGEGADALWLAEQGWTVTAVDVSAVALERAEQHAAASAAGNRITWLQRDLDAWAPEEQFDLVSAQFLHSTAAPWQRPHRVAAGAVRPGGTLLIVGHHPDGLPPWRSQADEDSHSHGGDGRANSEMFFTAEQAAAELGIAPPGWRVDVAASREREATGPDGQSAVLADAVLRATRITTDAA
ncbi:SAM-dependent methyltransferase [Arthrobacter globiformis]|uniref:SAM-dependent methyltransferase n=1 Tax=Arthrobacter globiformis TaxID=1665 RepID=UPI00277E0299|nr:class I SAM-dependent methyltransferase [Arthrobacter globiformis]MDQ1060601.1 SAM-dependent methyltransferase [Arthrobacter globiformis]